MNIDFQVTISVFPDGEYGLEIRTLTAFNTNISKTIFD